MRPWNPFFSYICFLTHLFRRDWHILFPLVIMDSNRAILRYRYSNMHKLTFIRICKHIAALTNIARDVHIWAPPSEFVSSSIPSWQTLTAHAQPFRGARDLVFCLKVPLDSLLVWASSGGSGETARMRRLAWTFAARIGDKYQIRLARPIFVSEKKISIYLSQLIGYTYSRSAYIWQLLIIMLNRDNTQL